MSWPREGLFQGFKVVDVLLEFRRITRERKQKIILKIRISTVNKIQYLFIVIALGILGKEGTSKNGWLKMSMICTWQRSHWKIKHQNIFLKSQQKDKAACYKSFSWALSCWILASVLKRDKEIHHM